MKYIYFNQKYYSNKPSLESGGTVQFIPEPWLFYNNKALRFFCHVNLSPKYNSRINLPFRKLWVKNIINHVFDRSDDVVIIINAHFYHLFYSDIKYYSEKKYRSVKFVFIFSDKIEYFKKNYRDFPDIDYLKKEFDKVITYNTEDAVNYGIQLDRPCFPNYSKTLDSIDIYTSDVFFVGANKGRLNKLLEIYEICQNAGLKCDFYITDVEKKDQKYDDKIVYNQKIDYSEVLEKAKRTKCILNIIQSGGAGVTLRDYETISFNKLALTNNTALKETGLYSKEQIIWLDEITNRLDDIRNGYKGSNNLRNEYSQSKWFEWLCTILMEQT